MAMRPAQAICQRCSTRYFCAYAVTGIANRRLLLSPFVPDYSPPMLVEEPRILEVNIFRTLRQLDRNQLLLDIMIITVGAGRQREETVSTFMVARAAA
jgi:hypothetical protein